MSMHPSEPAKDGGSGGSRTTGRAVAGLLRAAWLPWLVGAFSGLLVAALWWRLDERAHTKTMAGLGLLLSTLVVAVVALFQRVLRERAAAQAALRESTARRQAEEALEQLNQTLHQRIDEAVAELRRKDQVLIHQGRLAAMGEMIGNLAHQWRQPLNALSMLIINLNFAQSAGEMTDAYMNESAATANRLIQKMSSTINDFRDFFCPDKEKVDFSALRQVGQAVALVDASFKSRNIELIVDETVDCTLRGFPNEYSQVLLNLLSNCKEAIAERRIARGRVRIDIRRDDTMGVVTVTDNGGGIPEHLLGRIFQPYFTTKSKGAGMGLYMSQMIIEQNMDGVILARNVEGGSAFSISVPLARA